MNQTDVDCAHDTFRPGWLQSLLFALSVLWIWFTGFLLQPSGIFDSALLMFLPATVLGGIASGLRVQDRRKGQQTRDTRAAQILEALTTGECPKYSVYLRTFLITAELEVTHRETSNLFSWSDKENCQDLEMILARAFETFQPLIALGKPGEHFGAGRILTEEEAWRDQIDLLLRSAATIVIVPSHRDGTRWEIDWLLRKGKLSRALFVMPPSDKFTRLNVREQWQLAQQALTDVGLTLPDYDPRGGVFIFTGRDAPPRFCTFPRNIRSSGIRHKIKNIAEKGKVQIFEPRRSFAGTFVGTMGALVWAAFLLWIRHASDGQFPWLLTFVLMLIIGAPVIWIGYQRDKSVC